MTTKPKARKLTKEQNDTMRYALLGLMTNSYADPADIRRARRLYNLALRTDFAVVPDHG